jgi:hypothetical protein
LLERERSFARERLGATRFEALPPASPKQRTKQLRRR